MFSMDGNIIKAFLTLIGSVAILGILLIIVKKVTLQVKSRETGLNLKVTSKLGLGSKSQLFVVQVNNRSLLLGVTEKSINLIADVTDQENKTLLNPKAEIVKKEVKQDIKDQDLSFRAFLKSAVLRQN